MLPLNTFAKSIGKMPTEPIKVLGLKEALSGDFPSDQVGVFIGNDKLSVDFEALERAGFRAVIQSAESNLNTSPIPMIHSIRNSGVIAEGDVIRFKPSNGQVSVLYRRGANANSLFVTERCNSKCLMCSQPPRDDDDSWMVNEILGYVNLIDKDMSFLGITGGEPTLLENGLSDIILKCREHLPNTKLHILTNGRTFSNLHNVKRFDHAVNQVIWAIPLYSDLRHTHDYVVQAKDAYQETINGIYNLAESGHLIEIRFVLHKQTLDRLPMFAEFIYRNMPFVSHVALMGLEPMGYAKVNRDILWVDPADYAAELTDAAWYLENRGIITSIYNVPLCVLPKKAWPLAQKSISDWKNVYDPECDSCSVKDKCCGFFSSYGAAWKSRAIKSVGSDF
ncbi:His-Xaa-Ser system radical SAM maturase HxsC [Micavibrio aeruginosavorus]|uniref:Radical SAM core domain-containing protein n=1 Tax=Micavibrio aeruginosavorus EPB TaxID=349215 RepID=M4VEN0_9BACT|nr:His-Xaa-Ser system radical SAM maturase HxsC [Micavibrio aeruginosavorus]AGH97688.1 hypothetical protein A11S_865 [Micavibrio aeruginosavorus EPB]